MRKNPMKTRIQSFTIFVLLVAFSTSLNAQTQNNRADRPGFDRQERMQKMQNQPGAQHMRLMAVLDLDEDQKKAIKTIHLNGQKDMLVIRTSVQQKQAELRTLSVGDNYDEAKVSKLADELGELRSDMLKKKAAHQQQIKQILNEEQRIKFDNFHFNRSGKMGGKRSQRWNR